MGSTRDRYVLMLKINCGKVDSSAFPTTRLGQSTSNSVLHSHHQSIMSRTIPLASITHTDLGAITSEISIGHQHAYRSSTRTHIRTATNLANPNRQTQYLDILYRTMVVVHTNYAYPLRAQHTSPDLVAERSYHIITALIQTSTAIVHHLHAQRVSCTCTRIHIVHIQPPTR
jgi:hypothetical protein